MRSIASLCEEFGVRSEVQKETIRAQKKLIIIRLFLGVTRRQIRSIVNLCEEFGVRSKVQKETIIIILE